MKLRILNLDKAYLDIDLHSIEELDNWMYSRTVFSRFEFLIITRSGAQIIDANMYDKVKLREDIVYAWNTLKQMNDMVKGVAN